MANQDFFADIALTQHPISNTDKEIPPREIPKKFGKIGGEGFPYDRAGAALTKTMEQRQKEFQEELEALRKEYAPYLENHMEKVVPAMVTQLDTFEFRYAEKGEVFTGISSSNAPWETVTIPDYRGPQGKWRAYYRTRFVGPVLEPGKRAVLQFQCVDYKAFIYVNGNYVGQHEGLFAPFSFDITDYISDENELIIEVHNDVPTKGDDGPKLDGDKIYAATGPGWDDPCEGWHHCPPGAGVLGKVTFEIRPEIFIDDIFVRPNIDEDYVELRLGVMNYSDELPEGFLFQAVIGPKNFTGEENFTFEAAMKIIGRGKNEYRYRIPMKDYRLWTCEKPYLYGIITRIYKDDQEVTCGFGHFGMRKFVSDETTEPKGKFFFNNKPIIMRGANEMGHLQQCVMNGDFEQLIDDILIAKMCHMNYYRLTQRPVQEEIYDYMDMLGMMNQSDLPLFSFLRRNQAMEAVKQAGEMEHLIRKHPSAFMVSFINEPMCIRKTEDPESKFSKRYEMKGHRHLFRDELEAFFEAARKMIYIENPDRVIKNIEGDYDPPTGSGMPDFHTYTMWYSNHPIPVGRLAQGVIPPVKEGWMIGCGEYGAEGLDHTKLMLERYPEEWLEKDEEGNWYPTRIVRAQTNAMHGDWFAEKTNMEDWVEASQTHQAAATTMMTDAFRRRADYIGHTAIHLLIDAWPAGWMKTLVGCDRIPKKAYFSYQDALVPYRMNFYCPRNYVHSKDKIPVQTWLLNDSQEDRAGKIVATLHMEDKCISNYEIEGKVAAAYSECLGLLEVEMPNVSEETYVTLDGALLDEQGNVVSVEQIGFYVYPSNSSLADNLVIGTLGARAEEAAEKLGCKADAESRILLVTDMAGNEEQVKQCLEAGGNVLWLAGDLERGDYRIGELEISLQKGKNVYFVTAALEAENYHFNMLYNEKEDYLDFIARNVIRTEGGKELAYIYAPDGVDGKKAPKRHRPVVKKVEAYGGSLYIATLATEGKIGVNGNLDSFILDCLLNKF